MKLQRKHILPAVIAAIILAIVGVHLWLNYRSIRLSDHADEVESFLEGYAEIAYQAYGDAWQEADTLRTVVNGLAQKPDGASLTAARQAWRIAHGSFLRSEVFRFSNGPIDNEQMGQLIRRINPWPVEPAHIDGYQNQALAGLVHDTTALPEIAPEPVIALHQPDEGRTLLGFHALRLLLWGIPAKGSVAPTRDPSDFGAAKNAERRGAYALLVATQLVADLKLLHDAWHPTNLPSYRQVFLALPPEEAMRRVLRGLAKLCRTEYDGKTGRYAEVMGMEKTLADIASNLEGVHDIYHGIFLHGGYYAKSEVPLQTLADKANPFLSKQLQVELQSAALDAVVPDFLREEKIKTHPAHAAKLAKQFAKLAGQLGVAL